MACQTNKLLIISRYFQPIKVLLARKTYDLDEATIRFSLFCLHSSLCGSVGQDSFHRKIFQGQIQMANCNCILFVSIAPLTFWPILRFDQMKSYVQKIHSSALSGCQDRDRAYSLLESCVATQNCVHTLFRFTLFLIETELHKNKELALEWRTVHIRTDTFKME